jgi:hypothetical protein
MIDIRIFIITPPFVNSAGTVPYMRTSHISSHIRNGHRSSIFPLLIQQFSFILAPAMTKLPPGIIYLVPLIPQLLIGPISTYLLLKLSQTFYGIFYFSTWVTVILLILSGPVIFGISLAWNDFKNYRAARAIGAVLPPRIVDFSPGNIYSIWKEIQQENTGYFGEILSLFFFLFF